MSLAPRVMRFCIPKLSIIALVISHACVPAKAAGGPFSLTISTIQGSVSSGSDIQLTIKLTNETDHDITLTDRDQVCDFIVEVRDSNGQPVAETNQKRTRKCTDLVAGKLIILRLKPGERQEYTLFLNQLYDMTRPDTYNVLVAREIPKQIGTGQIKSNVIAIEITE